MLQLLLDKGINVNARDHQGKTALALMVPKHPHWYKILPILVKFGADLDLPDYGISYLNKFLYL
jgi:hypothetical protein